MGDMVEGHWHDMLVYVRAIRDESEKYIRRSNTDVNSDVYQLAEKCHQYAERIISKPRPDYSSLTKFSLTSLLEEVFSHTYARQAQPIDINMEEHKIIIRGFPDLMRHALYGLFNTLLDQQHSEIISELTFKLSISEQGKHPNSEMSLSFRLASDFCQLHREVLKKRLDYLRDVALLHGWKISPQAQLNPNGRVLILFKISDVLVETPTKKANIAEV